MENILTMVGTLFSVIGAAISLYQAKMAKKEANFVRVAKTKFVAQQAISDLAHLDGAFQKLLRGLSKYGPAATPKSLKGVNTQHDAEEVQEFVLLLQECKGLFCVMDVNEADLLCDKLTPLVEKLANSSDFRDMADSGKAIFLLLSGFSSKLKEMRTDKGVEATLQ